MVGTEGVGSADVETGVGMEAGVDVGEGEGDGVGEGVWVGATVGVEVAGATAGVGDSPKRSQAMTTTDKMSPSKKKHRTVYPLREVHA